MTKFSFLLIILVAFAGCTKDTRQADNVALYKQALKNADYSTAKVALNQLLLMDSSNIEHNDSLAQIYLNEGNLKTGLKYATKVMDAGKAGTKLQELVGTAYLALGEADKSKSQFTKLFGSTQDYKYFYQLAGIELNQGNYAGCDSMTAILLENIKSDSLVASKTLELQGAGNTMQQVPLEAAVYLMNARSAYEQRDVRKAFEYLNKSVDVYQPFYLPRVMAQQIEEQEYQRQQAQRR